MDSKLVTALIWSGIVSVNGIFVLGRNPPADKSLESHCCYSFERLNLLVGTLYCLDLHTDGQLKSSPFERYKGSWQFHGMIWSFIGLN